MGILHIGHEAGFVTAPSFRTDNYFNTTYSRCAATGYYLSPVRAAFAATDVFTDAGLWLHFYMHVPTSGGTGTSPNWITLYSSTGAVIFRITKLNGFSVYNAAGILIGAATGFSWTGAGIYDFWIRKDGDDTKLSIWKNAVLLVEITTSAITGLAKTLSVDSYGTNNGSSAWFSYLSEIIVATESTLNWRVFTKAPTGNGNYTGWTGGFGDVDDINPDALYAESDTAEQKVTYTFPAIGAALGDNVIKGVALGGLVQAEAGLKRIVRAGGVDDYEELSGVATAFAPNVSVMPLNPVTDEGWGQIDISTLEFGYESL